MNSVESTKSVESVKKKKITVFKPTVCLSTVYTRKTEIIERIFKMTPNHASVNDCLTDTLNSVKVPLHFGKTPIYTPCDKDDIWQ